jgi:hypothetical protein
MSAGDAQFAAEHDETVVNRLIAELRPSENTWRALLGLATEIAKRDKRSLASVLLDGEVEAIRCSQTVSRKEKQRQIRRVFERMRYPIRAQLESEVERRVEVIRKECGVRLELPRDLEGDAVKLTFAVRSADELMECVERLKQVAQHQNTGEIFSLLRGEIFPESPVVKTNGEQ